jgi:hypothetical protein
MLYCITFKNTSFKEIKVKNIDTENIYKKCGYKSNNNFKKLYEWYCSSNNVIELWCKEDSNVKTYNNYPLLVKYNIKVNINNKCIFLMKNGPNYINLESVFFSKYFNLPETIEFNTNEDSVEHSIEDNSNQDNTQVHDLLNMDKNKHDDLLDTSSDTNSELSYELYCYSDEEP